MTHTYQLRPVVEVTTEDLITTIAADRNSLATFEARAAFTARTGQNWRLYAPSVHRHFVDTKSGKVGWHNFCATGWL